ncbi:MULTISPECIES: serine hydrolase [unclassified Sulfuricurvum]|uniref:D-alanyl-D-alanine carboxypeptidase family protein n=1 Tax=unclassified Sulfuricurvum TaxID=2632390 RepID=UPI0002998A71|nr:MULTISPECIES: serine hydrolase [unclassified Sulfuricurvum]OHD83783.1 MAG: peptidase S11 [Sulfuricurvum sp. RIFCSPHIGHO2_02_FULL_43_9]OHD84130.1 MAG: peptidase S11 [Sulfuricurvum sp. RIFCSPLOWO2_02_43_6]OHD86503.1 MAG: peptidase S11 [Sulfuricurvum sp. RIFCSPLOWO2_02_FULL_43_45]AFV97897.1 peptidase s11 d-alanyl-d-alanine carboxypeptidase 1 [Candidatus Sulfuricurvum sp. RIFRC-1]OHD89003.1 MAG: peptidase S11 [Sulfuricurvum sp. RIFCSPLOWO2_12_FULL_43_24]
MIYRYLTLICLLLTLSSHAEIDKNGLDKLNVEALLVKELTSGEVIYSKEALKEVKPASLTKIMTAMLAIEQGNLDRPVTITAEMIAVEPTKAGYKEGEVIRLEDLIKAAMIKSDNDAAMAIAISVGGDLNTFVQMMNLKAAQIGMDNTFFTNPCGFDIANHHSTPIDLLHLAEYAIQNSLFNDITRQNQHIYYSLNTNRKFVAKTHNYLLNRYEYAVGVKTGYTSKAGPCLIARAKKEGNDCLIVMLNSKENRWSVAQQIFEQVFLLPVIEYWEEV